MLVIVPLLLTALWLVLVGGGALAHAWRSLLQAGGRRGARRETDWRELLLTAPIDRALEKAKLYDRLQLMISSYHSKLVILNGKDWTLTRTKRTAAAAVSYGYSLVTGCGYLAWLAGEPLLLAIGAIVGVLAAARPILEAGRRIERRKQEILLELPEALSKLMLLVSAGETTLRAMARCLDGKDAEKHPLYKEWNAVVRSLETGESFATAVERLNRSCAVQEVSVFTTVLLLNYRRGGDHFTLALRELSYTLWEKRKAVARSRGEEASSKLVFPLVGILLALMVLVAAPAVLLMS